MMLALFLLISIALRRAGVMVNERTFSDDEEQAFVDQHNWWRNQAALGLLNYGRKASQMPRVFYDSELARNSKAWSQFCVFGYSGPADFNTLSYNVGENIYWTSQLGITGEKMAKLALKGWGDEHLDYNPYTKECSAVCGHYTQVAWESSVRIGCGASECSEIDHVTNWAGTVVVCQYYPQGNWVGRDAYTFATSNTGESCGNGVYGNSTGMDSTWPGLCNNDCDVDNSCSSSEILNPTSAPIPSPTRSPVEANILSEIEIQGFVDRHNYWRNLAAMGNLTGGAKASQMPQVFWDSELAENSANWSQYCNYTSSKAFGGWDNLGYRYGENLFVSTNPGISGTTLTDKAVDFWASYDDQWNPDNPISSYYSTAYIQVVWEKSVRIGCGVSRCSSVQGYSEGKTIVVCQYYKKMSHKTAPYTIATSITGESCVNGVYDESTGIDDTWTGLCNNNNDICGQANRCSMLEMCSASTPLNGVHTSYACESVCTVIEGYEMKYLGSDGMYENGKWKYCRDEKECLEWCYANQDAGCVGVTTDLTQNPDFYFPVTSVDQSRQEAVTGARITSAECGTNEVSTALPTSELSDATTLPTSGPTDVPTLNPTSGPTDVPTLNPTSRQTDVPTLNPTSRTTDVPTPNPTSSAIKESPTSSPVAVFREDIILSDDEMQGFVDRHNFWRDSASTGNLSGGVKAAQMPRVFWDAELAAHSKNHSLLCSPHNSSNYDDLGYGYGENIYTSSDIGMSGTILSNSAVDFWSSHHEYYNPHDRSCSNVCNPYLQVVWESSVRIGCGVTECPNIHGRNSSGTIIVCQYYPAMNSINAPFTIANTTGESCTNGVYGESTGMDGTWSGLCNNDNEICGEDSRCSSLEACLPSKPLHGFDTSYTCKSVISSKSPSKLPTSIVTQSPSYLPALAPTKPAAIVTWQLSLCCLKFADLLRTVISIAVSLRLDKEAVTLKSWTFIRYLRRRTDSDWLAAWDLTYDIEVESSDAANEIVEAVSSSDTISALENQIMEDIPESTVEVTNSSGTVTVLDKGEKGIDVLLVAVIAWICFVFIMLLAIFWYRKRSKAKVVEGDKCAADTEQSIIIPDVELITTTPGESTNVDEVEGEREAEISRTLLGSSPTAQKIENTTGETAGSRQKKSKNSRVEWV